MAARPGRIISGGQTGADRAALDFALERGVACGGWCPKGRIAEDGPIPAQYSLRETESADPAVRTGRNVADSDATLIFTPPAVSSPGTDLTIRVADELNKPHLILTGFPDAKADAALVRSFLAQHRPRVLNVAGPRESEAPGMYAHVRSVLAAVFALPA